MGDVRQLLGFLSYYQTYVQDFSRTAKPLYDLLQSKSDVPQPKPPWVKKCHQPSSQTPGEWVIQHQWIFEQVVDRLTEPPVLASPDFNLPFTLHTDASLKGLGAVLYQDQNGRMRVIGYGSHTLTRAQQNYHLHSGKLEFMALKWVVCDKFQDFVFLLGISQSSQTIIHLHIFWVVPLH